MNWRPVIVGLLLASSLATSAQLRSPDEFLGYKLGAHFTPHWKIVSYFEHVADNAKTTMKLEQYGTTNEGRPLLLAYISSAANIQNLEKIRQNNLRLAGLANDKMSPVEENAPVIVWLSYNVHGDEPSSSEAAMLTLFSLIDPANTATKDWLKNTVVIIDPCINPDGRDRYVNWYNSVVGSKPDPDLNAREHNPPWPGGRTNHYNFDLNRDWAWQTQVESKQRLKYYNTWMPQIHVDYHEQGINDAYYFAPAAESYHDVITPWQRNFQVTIGKNNAKYFDRYDWLYFTKEVFDLFYPSYGDTWPTFNGAIGMTYEQAGGPEGGLAALKNEGDTLTLEDRLMHHYTTGLSTIEISSQNASKLISEFRKYFAAAAANGSGQYKSFVIKNKNGDAQRIKSLIDLLDRNGISYSSAASGNGRAFHYNTGKDESFSFSNDDILVSTVQPKGSLVQALMEPDSRLQDSVTYDITAWSLPYVYGLDAYALKENWRSSGVYNNNVNNTTPPKTNYGYVIRWEGVQSVRVLTSLQNQGVVVRYAEQPFEVNGQSFERGSLIILRNGNKKFGNNLWDIVIQACNKEQIKANAISTGFVDKGYDLGGSKVHSLKNRKIVLASGEGTDPSAAGEIWEFFEQEIHYPVTLVNANDLSSMNWSDVDVLILPSGNYTYLNDKANVDKLKEWISKGGKLIAMRRAVAQLAKMEVGIKAKKADTETNSDSVYADLRVFGERDRLAASSEIPGAILKVQLDNTHPLAFGYPNYYYTLKLDDRVYEFLKDGWNVGVLKKEPRVSGFIGAGKRSTFKDGLLFGAQEMGAGTITYLADQPIYRGFWENGKLMLCNAVFLY